MYKKNRADTEEKKRPAWVKKIGDLFRKMTRRIRHEGTEHELLQAREEKNRQAQTGEWENTTRVELEKSREDEFVREWTDVFLNSADVFQGLFEGLVRVTEGRTKRPERIFREWCTRTRYQWEGQRIHMLTEECLPSGSAPVSAEDYRKWADLLLHAAEQAGIVRDAPGEAVLDERTANAYTEWDGAELYLGDKVDILTPAWYLDGGLIEQGTCRKL